MAYRRIATSIKSIDEPLFYNFQKIIGNDKYNTWKLCYREMYIATGKILDGNIVYYDNTNNVIQSINLLSTNENPKVDTYQPLTVKQVFTVSYKSEIDCNDYLNDPIVKIYLVMRDNWEKLHNITTTVEYQQD
jgi:hypothetical protein